MNFKQIARADITPILSDIHAHPELWGARPERKTAIGTPHAAMSDIWVRYNDISRLGPSFNDEHVPVNYPAWHALPSVRRLCFDLMAHVDGEMLGGVLITRIPPGARIEPHIDTGWHVEYYDKFYVCLQSEPGAVFHCEADSGADSLCPTPGEVHLFDNRKLHWVTNDSDQDRVTLIVCIRTNKEGFTCHLQ